MRTAVCLGAGMVGRLLAADLARERGVRVVALDRSASSLERARALAGRMGVEVETGEADLSDPAAIARAIEDADVVCGALASHLGFAALEAVCRAGKAYVDISFMEEDALEHDALAKERGARAVVDMGVAPGMSNLLAGEVARDRVLHRLDDVADAGSLLVRRLDHRRDGSTGRRRVGGVQVAVTGRRRGGGASSRPARPRPSRPRAGCG